MNLDSDLLELAAVLENVTYLPHFLYTFFFVADISIRRRSIRTNGSVSRTRNAEQQKITSKMAERQKHSADETIKVSGSSDYNFSSFSLSNIFVVNEQSFYVIFMYRQQ